MLLKILWENMTPNQRGALIERLEEFDFEVNDVGVVDVRNKEEIEGFPRPNRSYANIGFIRTLGKNGLCAGIANTNYRDLEEYHDVFEKCVGEVKFRYDAFSIKKG